MESSLRSRTFNGLIWSFLENFMIQILGFIIGVVLARLLSPSDYGLVGMIGVIGAVASAFINSGFSVALIRNLNRSEKDFSTTFYFNIAVGIFFYVTVFFLSPYIANFYGIPELENITKVMCLTFLLGSFTVVQQAKFIIAMDFKSLAIVAIVTTAVSGIISIYMAYNGYGVWALVWSYVITGFVRVILVWLMCGWYPTTFFSRNSFKWLFGFGSKILASSLIDTIYNNLMPIVIGKYFTASELGYYSRAQGYANLPSVVITGQVQKVTFPVLSEIQNDFKKMTLVYRKLISSIAFVVFPLMILLAAEARPLMLLLIGEKWNSSIILLQILSIAYMLYPVHALNLNLLEVIGRSDLFLKLEIIKKIMGTIILIVTIPFGIKAMCLGQIVLSILSLFINTHYTKKILGIKLIDQLNDLRLITLFAFSMGGVVYIADAFIKWNSLLLEVIILTTFAGLYYLALSKLFRVEGLSDMLSFVKYYKNK